MKNKILNILTLALICIFVSSCSQTDLDLQVSPNDLDRESFDPNLLLNSMQIAYAGNQQTLSSLGGEMTRIEYFFGRDYFNSLPGSTMDGIWRRTYSSEITVVGDSDDADVSLGIYSNLAVLEESNIDGALDFHVAIGKTLYAHSLLQIVDYIGSAAFSQVGSEEFPAPVLDDGEAVYASALTLLDEAEVLLNNLTFPLLPGLTDIFYKTDPVADDNNSISRWIKLINTIRLRSYVLTNNTSGFNNIIAEGNYISDSSDDFQVQYGTSALQPDNRHPDFTLDYKSDGAEIYQSNWLMSLMLNNDDPRLRYYFYRQSDGTPGSVDVSGADVAANEEDLACSLVVPPAHYDGFAYCSLDNGYWGRSHGNDEGTPPDNLKRTASGIYPVGGRFDDDSFGQVGLGLGGGGAGIEPIFLSSYIDFWQGIMATNATDKASFLRSGLEKSIAKVQSFAALDLGADKDFEPSADDVTAYIDGIVADFMAAAGDDQENIFAEQYFTTLYGGSTEAYNYYRLTGYPTTVYPNWEPDPGPFPRTLLLPQAEVINNPNVSQKGDLTTQVFWDTNPASPAFPPAN